jgi:hypothetical protein
MKCRFLGAVSFLLMGAGWVAAQAPTPALPPPTPQTPRTTAPAAVNYPAAGDTQGGALIGMAPPTVGDGPGYVPLEAVAPPNCGPVFYTDADYLLYRFRPGSIPTTAQVVPIGLISVSVTNTTVNTPPPTTSTMMVTTTLPVSIVNSAAFGNPSINFSSQNGGRIAFGFWVDSEQTWGLEARGELVERGVDNFATISGIAANPFVINTGLAPTTTTIVAPGAAGGNGVTTVMQGSPVVFVRQTHSSLVGNADNEFYSGELNARGVFLRLGCVDFGGLVGFRYLRYEEGLAIATNATLIMPAGVAQTPASIAADTFSQNLTFGTTDRLRVTSQFFGEQTGLDIDFKFGSFFLDVRGILGLGDMHQEAQVAGTTRVINNDPAHPTPASTFTTGGLLSGPGDQGFHSRDRFAYLPEVNGRFGCQLTSWFRCWVGYDALVIAHAASASTSTVTNTLNTTVTVGNSTNNVNVAQPVFRFQDRDEWIQGLTFGCEFRY